MGIEVRPTEAGFAATRDGVPAGRATLEELPWKGEAWVELLLRVEPEHRGHRVGTALWAAVERRLAERAVTLVDTTAADDDPVALGFAGRRGFVVTQHFVGMQLDLRTADEAVLTGAVRRVGGSGLSVGTVAEAAAALGEDAADRKLWELNRRLSPDIPGNGDTFPSYAEYRAEVIGADWFRRERQYVAADGDHWVGLSGVGVRPETRTATQEFSAVDRAYRRRGVGAALKARAALDARAAGLELMLTGNDATNTAIIALNEALGFTRSPGLVRLQRRAGP